MPYLEPSTLRRADLSSDPFDQFTVWIADAEAAQLPYPPAGILATADAGGRPTQRTVLLRKWDSTGFTFFTSNRSQKAHQLRVNPQVSLLLPWLGLQRQLMVSGSARQISREETAEFFATQPRESQLSTLVSDQTGKLESRGVLESDMTTLEEDFHGHTVPLPDHWDGFHISPDSFEFWQAGAKRLNDRFLYTPRPGGEWTIQRLAP